MSETPLTKFGSDMLATPQLGRNYALQWSILDDSDYAPVDRMDTHWYTKLGALRQLRALLSHNNVYTVTVYNTDGNYASYVGPAHENYRDRKYPQFGTGFGQYVGPPISLPES